MEEDRKNEEERRMREKGDNWRERGLDQMMGGVLEIKKEDELKKVCCHLAVLMFVFNSVSFEFRFSRLSDHFLKLNAAKDSLHEQSG